MSTSFLFKTAGFSALWIASLAATWHLARKNPEIRVVEKPVEVVERVRVQPAYLEGPEAPLDRLQERLRAQREAASERERRFGKTERPDDPVQAMIHAFGAGDRPDLQHRLDQLSRNMTESDIDTALERLNDMPLGPFRSKFQNAVMGQWTKLNPLAAMDFTAGIEEPKRRHDLRLQMFQSWAESEPLQALVYAEMNPTENMPASRFAAVFEGARKGNADNALMFLAEVDYDKYRRQITDTVYEMFNDYPNRMIEWTEKLPSGKLRDTAYHRTLDHWARYDPLAAKQWMERTVEPHFIKAANVELGESWARVDPRSAADWAMGLPKEQDNPHIMDRVLHRWMQYDRDDAVNWLGEQPPSPQLDRSLQTYVRSSMHRDPAGSIAMAESIQKPESRAKAIEQVAYTWMRRNPEASAEYVAGSKDLSDKQKDRLIKMYEKTVTSREAARKAAEKKRAKDS